MQDFTNYLPFYDVAILSVLAKNYFNKPYVVRFDGLYNDKNNTIGDTRKLNSILQKKTENASELSFKANLLKNFMKLLVKLKKTLELFITE